VCTGMGDYEWLVREERVRENDRRTFGQETGCDFKVDEGDEGGDGDEDQEVDLGG
jgi:hypothetical protein